MLRLDGSSSSFRIPQSLIRPAPVEQFCQRIQIALTAQSRPHIGYGGDKDRKRQRRAEDRQAGLQAVPEGGGSKSHAPLRGRKTDYQDRPDKELDRKAEQYPEKDAVGQAAMPQSRQTERHKQDQRPVAEILNV